MIPTPGKPGGRRVIEFKASQGYITRLRLKRMKQKAKSKDESLSLRGCLV